MQFGGTQFRRFQEDGTEVNRKFSPYNENSKLIGSKYTLSDLAGPECLARDYQEKKCLY